jgi:ActR/RegA family two-component response regulator
MTRRLASKLTRPPVVASTSSAPFKRVILFGMPAEFCAALTAQARKLSYTASAAQRDAIVTAELSQRRPTMVLVNLDEPSALTTISLCRDTLGIQSRIAAITDAPCLIRAAHAVREGAFAVLARPTTFAQIIAAVEGRPQHDPAPMSFDRAIWEYLNQTLVETGSLSATARRLRLDRTSLKRMLRKNPPRS